MGKPSDTIAQGPTFEADAWRDFQEKFDLLAREDQDQSLRAQWTSWPPMTRVNSDLLERGLLCWLYVFEHGGGWWRLMAWSWSPLPSDDGRRENVMERYAALATRAGTMLSPPRGVAPLNFGYTTSTSASKQLNAAAPFSAHRKASRSRMSVTIQQPFARGLSKRRLSSP